MNKAGGSFKAILAYFHPQETPPIESESAISQKVVQLSTSQKEGGFVTFRARQIRGVFGRDHFLGNFSFISKSKLVVSQDHVQVPIKSGKNTFSS